MSGDKPDHIEVTVQQMADLHAEHAATTPLQGRVAALTLWLSRPIALVIVLVVVLGWLVLNTAATGLDLKPFDAPPFPLLAAISSLVALLTTLLILGTQRKEEELARRRSQLTLQLTALCEQKIAKVISLMEEQRRENPLLPSREDSEAKAMATPVDPGHVLDRIIETHEGEKPAEGR